MQFSVAPYLVAVLPSGHSTRMQGTVRRKRQHLRDVSLDLPKADRLRLAEALRASKTLDQAARVYGMADVPGFRQLATREGFAALVRPLIFPLRHISAAQHRTFMRWIREGKSSTAIARTFGVKRQAIEQRIQRLGLWATYREARGRAKERYKGMWPMLSAPPYRRLLPIAAALAARGVTVGCVPVFNTDCRQVVDCRLIADGAPVRVLRPVTAWRGMYRADIRDLSAHYVIELPDGDRLWYPVPHSPGPVNIPHDDAASLLTDSRTPPAAFWGRDTLSDPWADESTADPSAAPAEDDVDAAGEESASALRS